MKDLIKGSVWGVFLVSILTGIIITIVEIGSTFFIGTFFIDRAAKEWTQTTGNIVFWQGIILAVILFLFAVLFYFRDTGKIHIAKSASIVVGYYIIVLGIEQLFWSTGHYPVFLVLLFTPVRQYSVIFQVLLRFTELPIWISLTLTALAPYLYVVFGKKRIRQFPELESKIQE